MTARVLLAVGLLAVGCYDVPKPDCGFRCDANTGCPDGYTCASDGRCHREGADPSLVCPTADAGMPAYSPRIVSSVPMVGQTVDPASTLRVTFDVNVAGVGPPSFGVVDRTTQALIDGVVSYDGDTRTASWSAPDGMPENRQLSMILTEQIFDPVTSKPLMEAPISFATGPDVTSPQVDFISPPNAAVGVQVDAEVFLSFTESVLDVATIESVTLDGPSGFVPSTVLYSVPAHTARLIPGTQLAPNAAYTVKAGLPIRDESGNPLVPFVSTFTTGADAIMPAVSQITPAPGSTGVAVGANVVVTFDEAVLNVTASTFTLNGGAIAGTITMSNGNRTATFDPTANLPAASTINIGLTTGITDTSGNALASSTFSFATQ